jgi:hypothetical protein
MNDTLDSGTASSPEITEQGISHLKGSAPWMKFMSIMGFIGSALIILSAFVMLAAGSDIPNGAIIGVIYIALGGVYIYVSYILWQWASSVSTFVLSRDSRSLENAFARQKALWMTAGILTIVFMALMLIGMIAGINMMSQQDWSN